MDSLEMGHSHSWLAVRRLHNGFADHLATLGVSWGHALRARGCLLIHSLSVVATADRLLARWPPRGRRQRALFRVPALDIDWTVDAYFWSSSPGRRDILVVLPSDASLAGDLFAIFRGPFPLLDPDSSLPLL